MSDTIGRNDVLDLSDDLFDHGRRIEDISDDGSFRVLVVEDQQLYAQALSQSLVSHGMECDIANTAADGIALAGKNPDTYQAILLDHKLPDDDGIKIIPVLLRRQKKSSLFVMTAYETIPNAIQAIRQGADDYIVKDPSVQPLVERVAEVRRKWMVRRGGTGWDEHKKDGLLGNSEAIVAVREQIEKVAPMPETSVLFTGETGVGKEVAARYLHNLSKSSSSPFISVDCVALPSNLVESLLFGHEKGTFTGAHQSRDGVFKEAGSGTVFLDEIGDMDVSLQGKLLRVLETRRFHRVGSVKEQPVTARIIAATNKDLLQLVKQGDFRFDLYQRLSIFPVHLPPLRDRGEDSLLMARHFVEFFAAKMGRHIKPLSRQVKERILAYDFPGNVRELKNIIERAIIISETDSIELDNLPHRMLSHTTPMPTTDDSRAVAVRLGPTVIDFIPGVDTMNTLEEKLINHALERTNGVKSEAARFLGISRFQLLRRLQKYRMQQDIKSN